MITCLYPYCVLLKNIIIKQFIEITITVLNKLIYNNIFGNFS